MSSISGIRDGDFDRLRIVQDLAVGQDQNFGTSGQVLTSAGEGEELFWGTNSATLPQGLVAGTNITFTPAGTYNGSVETTISATDTNTEYTAGNGIQISGSNQIQTRTDNDTIRDSGGGSGNKLEVIKVPNTLTITQGATSVVFDGETAKSITLTDADTTYQADLGVEIDTSTNPDTIKAKVDSSAQPTLRNDLNTNELAVLRVPNNLTCVLGLEYSSGTSYDGSAQRILNTKVDGTTIDNQGGAGFDELNVKKVPNTLTITDSAGTSVVFDGSAPKTITINDDDTTYQAGTGISIDTTTDPDTINCSNIPNSALANSTISGISLGSNLANLTAGTNISFDVGTTYNGSTAVTISATDTDTGITDLNEGDGINITDVSATEKTISANIDTNTLEFKTDTLGAPEPKEIAVKKVPNTLTISQGGVSTIFDGSSAQTITIASGTADHSVVSRLGNSATTSTFTSPHTSVTPTLTTGMVGIAGLGIEGMTAVSTAYEVSVDFLMTQEARSGVQTAQSYIRLDSVANNTIVGWGSANGVYAPIRIQSGSASNTLTTRAFYGRLSYKWVIINLTIGSSYNFIPRFTTFAPSASSLTRMAIQYGGAQGFATVTATPIQINTPTGMSEQEGGDDY